MIDNKLFFSKKYVFVFGLACLFLFTVFSYTIKKGAMRSVDFACTVKLQEAIDRSPRLRLSRLVGDVMEGSTFFASPEVSVIAVLFLTIVSFIILRSIDTSKRRVLVRVLGIPILFTLLILAEIYGKTVVHHPAPPFFMIKNPTSIFPKYYINEQFSYPSGHTARAVFLSIIFSYLLLLTSYLTRKRRIVICALISVGYIGLVAISRIYLGHHWLSDIIGGSFLGSGLSLLVVGFLF